MRPGCSDDHLDALDERLDLGLVGATAVDLKDAHGAALSGDVEVLRHLDGQFARRGDDERLRLAGLGEGVPSGLARTREVLEEGNAEAERLARPGLGLADDVVAAEGDGQGHFLDREGGDDADGVERLDDRRADAEVGERAGGRDASCGGVTHEEGS